MGNSVIALIATHEGCDDGRRPGGAGLPAASPRADAGMTDGVNLNGRAPIVMFALSGAPAGSRVYGSSVSSALDTWRGRRGWDGLEAVVRKLIEVPLDDGGVVLVEVEDHEDGIVRSARPGEVVATAAESLQASLDRIRPVAGALVAKLRDLADRPEEITVEFGIKWSAQAGVIVAQAASEANFKVALRWARG